MWTKAMELRDDPPSFSISGRNCSTMAGNILSAAELDGGTTIGGQDGCGFLGLGELDQPSNLIENVTDTLAQLGYKTHCFVGYTLLDAKSSYAYIEVANRREDPDIFRSTR